MRQTSYGRRSVSSLVAGHACMVSAPAGLQSIDSDLIYQRAEMGITYFDARVLCSARLGGASFRETLTIAHLSLNLHEHEVASLRQMYATAAGVSGVDPFKDYVFGRILRRIFEELPGNILAVDSGLFRI